MLTQTTLGFSSSGMCKAGQKLAQELGLYQEAWVPLLPLEALDLSIQSQLFKGAGTLRGRPSVCREGNQPE